jgi:hypothetical protein
VGTLRTRESWNPRRSLGQYAGAAYNLLPVQWSAGASLLLAAPARGVFEVDPKQLESRAVGIPETYFIFMPVDGLIVYETRSRIAAALAIALGSITLDIAGKYLADKYDRIPGAPRRKPGFAFMETPRSTPNVPEFELCQQLNGGICRIDPVNLFEPFPELFRPEGEPHLLPPLDFFGDDDFDVFPFDILMNEGM